MPFIEYNSDTVPNPGKTITDYVGVGEFDRIAERILESGKDSNQYRISQESNEVKISQVEKPERDKEKRLKFLSSRLRSVAALTMNYTGEYSFSEDGYETAFTDTVASLFYDKSTYDIVAPVLNVKFGENDDFNFESPETFWIREDKVGNSNYKVEMNEKINISPITKEERSAMLSCGDGLLNEFSNITSSGSVRTGGDSESRSHRGGTAIASTHKIQFTINTIASPFIHPPSVHMICNRIIGILRLLFPSENIEIDDVYLRENQMASYKHGIPLLEQISGGNHGSRFPSNREFSTLDLQSISESWPICLSSLSSINYFNTDNPFIRPYERFQSMYEKRKDEDGIIDCFIAIEQSLLKDWKGSYSFILPTRATVLLEGRVEQSGSHVYEFFDLLQSARNDIIHGDKRMDEIISHNSKIYTDLDIEGMSGNDFVQQSREYLAAILMEYMMLCQETDSNITQVNTDTLTSSIKSQLKSMDRSWQN